MTTQTTIRRLRITPKTAERILHEAERAFDNRPIKLRIVAQYAHDMAMGAWSERTGETIKFANIGGINVLIDGQHRMHALIEANVTLLFDAAYNVPEADFTRIDHGVSRSVTDTFHHHGGGWTRDAGALATTVRNLMVEDVLGGGPGAALTAAAPTKSELGRYGVENYPDLPAVRDKYLDVLESMKRRQLGPFGQMLYLAYRWQRIDPALTERVMAYLHTASQRRYADQLSADNPGSQRAEQIREEYPEIEPPHPSWPWAVAVVGSVNAPLGKALPVVGKPGARRTRDAVWYAYSLAWNLTLAKDPRKGNRAAFTRAVNDAITSPPSWSLDVVGVGKSR